MTAPPSCDTLLRPRAAWIDPPGRFEPLHVRVRGNSIAEMTTDNYGDFKFDRLDEESGSYTVEVSANGRSKSVDVELGVSRNLGEIRL